MILLIFLGITFFLQLLAASWYDLAQKTADPKKAFKHKMLCSAIYVADVLLCTAINKSLFNAYSVIFVCAYVLLFIGDVLEARLKSAGTLFSSLIKAGSLGGLTAALICKNLAMFREDFFQRLPLTAIATSISAVIILIAVIRAKKQMHIPLAIILVAFTIQSILLGIPLQQSAVAINQTASCAVIMGSLATAFSSLLLIFDPKGKKSLLKTNTYYFGLMFLSCSVAIL